MIQTVLITGASTGIGKATAELFFERGWNVVATMRTPPKSEPHPQDSRWIVARLDVTDPLTIESAAKEAIDRFGRIDVWVNNAGYGLVGTFESMNGEHIRRQFETNVFGTMRCAQTILPHFRQNCGGVLINVTSIGARLTFPFYSVYHATKWAVDGFSESLQFELRPLGIRVKIIEPGAIRTDFYDRSADFVHDQALISYNNMVEKGMAKMNATGRNGAPPSTVAEVIWKASTDGSWRLRYVAGLDAKALLTLRRVIPTRAYQALVRSQVLK
ncbi:MAG: SDR family oxidoreductase [Planctomycetes bacterium]|nr:SDR family oxidoreductase [Planctomycetota bacterium]